MAGQVEYWATLGRIVEHSGLTAQEAIEGYEAAAKKVDLNRVLDSIEARFTAVDESGCLADRVRQVVDANRAKAADLQQVA